MHKPTVRAFFDDDTATWQLTTDAGERIEADVLISGQGMFGELKYPDIEGRDTFAGPSFHSARWRHDVELAGDVMFDATLTCEPLRPTAGRLTRACWDAMN